MLFLPVSLRVLFKFGAGRLIVLLLLIAMSCCFLLACCYARGFLFACVHLFICVVSLLARLFVCLCCLFA